MTDRTANPYGEAMFKDALRRQYELGRKDGYDEAVKMIRRATQALQRDKKKGGCDLRAWEARMDAIPFQLRRDVGMALADTFQALRQRHNRDLLGSLPLHWALEMADEAIRLVKEADQ